MNIGKRITKSGRDITAVVAVLALVSACSTLPPLDEVRTVALRTDFRAYGTLAVDVDGNPETRPGRMAAGSLEGLEGCGIAFLVCVPIFMALGAATGAVITAVETLPEEQALELNRVSASVVTGLNLDSRFANAIRKEALRQRIVLTRGYADARVNIEVTAISWDVSVGNNVAIQIDFKVTGSVDGRKGHRNITYRSKRAKFPDWVADSGQRIRATLLTIMEEASQQVWQQILGRGNEYQI